MNKLLVNVSVLAALFSLPAVYSQGTCFPCPTSCTACNWDNGVLTITKARNGYQIDNFNKLCYPNCAKNEYYNSQFQQCVTCGNGCSTCSVNNKGNFEVKSANNGFDIDYEVGTCYKCSSDQYYDPYRHECFNCPNGCTSCKWNQEDSYLYNVKIQKAKSGFTIDAESNTCVETCSNGQYYNLQFGICDNCPDNCRSCYGGINGVIISNAANGYRIDQQNQLCYKSCNNNEYYNPNSFSCVPCGDGCSKCNYDNFVYTVDAAQSGYTVDIYNNICYPSCQRSQYYDPGQLQCNNCPDGCSSCVISNGYLTINGAKSGYTIDNSNGVCYKNCENNEYYRPF